MKGNLDNLNLCRDFALGIGEEFVRLNLLILPIPTSAEFISFASTSNYVISYIRKASNQVIISLFEEQASLT